MFYSLLLAASMFQSGLLPISDIPSSMTRPAPAESKVLVKVNGVEIRASDLEPLLWEWRSQEVLLDLVNYRVVKDAAQKANITVADAEVTKQLTEYLTEMAKSLPQGQTPQMVLEAQGLTQSRLFLRLKTELLLRQMILREFKPDEWVKVSTIIIRPEGEGTDAIKKAADRADAAYKRLNAGEKFEDVLKDFTNEPMVLQSKGQIGWRHYDAFPDGVKNELKTIGVGKVTKPVQTAHGIQIFKMDMRGKDVTGDNLEDLKAFVATSQRQIHMSKLGEQAKIERGS